MYIGYKIYNNLYYIDSYSLSAIYFRSSKAHW